MQIQMIKILNEMKADIIKALLMTVADNFYDNPDIELAMKSEEMELFLEENNIKLPFSKESLAGQETIALYKKIAKYTTGESVKPSKMKKKDAIAILQEIFENDEMFEMLALMISEVDTENLLTDLGWGEKYEQLKKDPVFCARKKYILSISAHYQAAVNLYGVIHISELYEMLDHNEKKEWKNGRYQRTEGFHAKTMLFSPEFFSEEMLSMIMENCFARIPISFDEFLLHESFGNQCLLENTLLEDYMESYNGNDFEKMLDSFLEKESKAEFRDLYDEAANKPRYFPEKSQFLKFADEEYLEMTHEVTQLKIYLKKKYSSAIKQFALETEQSEADALNDMVREIRFEISSNDADTWMERGADFIQSVFELLEEYGIQTENMDEMNQLLSYIMQLKNAERIWINGGYSPKEMATLLPASDKMTIVPGSSHAASLLKECQTHFLGSKINIDLDSNAVPVPSILYPNGLQSKGHLTGINKVYPNDPCPCGSGKKFKKCCGKG